MKQYSQYLITTSLQRWRNIAEQIASNPNDTEYTKILADTISDETQSLLNGIVPEYWMLFGDAWINDEINAPASE